MIDGLRSRLALLFATLGLAAGCSGGTSTSQTGTLSCADSVANACARTGGCALAWNDADLVAAFCPDPTVTAVPVFECGGYHVIRRGYAETESDDYYDAASGNLAAIVTVHHTMTADPAGSGSVGCDAGPAVFTLPSCPGASTAYLSQCAPVATTN
jgi:hypothetical protein